MWVAVMPRLGRGDERPALYVQAYHALVSLSPSFSNSTFCAQHGQTSLRLFSSVAILVLDRERERLDGLARGSVPQVPRGLQQPRWGPDVQGLVQAGNYLLDEDLSASWTAGRRLPRRQVAGGAKTNGKESHCAVVLFIVVARAKLVHATGSGAIHKLHDPERSTRWSSSSEISSCR